jgi:hypothetical protein
LADLTSLMLKTKAWLTLNGLRAVTALRLFAGTGAGIRELLIAEQHVNPYT